MPEAPSTPQSAAADITAFLAEPGNAPSADAAAADPVVPDDSVSPGGNEAPPDPDDASAADDAPDGQGDGEPSAKPVAVDTDALLAALEAGDPAAFIAALGDKADAVLTGKAHKVLRLQLKDAKAAQEQAQQLTQGLAVKYGDPISARKAAEAGDVDSFVDMVEKWAGNSWNDVMKWVAKGIQGRPERLEAKQRDAAKVETGKTVEQAKALDETRVWVGDSLKKADAKLLESAPELVDLVIAEIKTGLAKGVDTPAKALPLAKAKLKTQYERLHAVFGAGGAAPKPKTVVVATRRDKDTPVNTRPMSLQEEIATFVKQEGLK